MPVKNPNHKSLKYLSFAVAGDGFKRSVPALDKFWAPRSVFAHFTGLIDSGGQIKRGAALEEWQYEAESFKDDMEFLLRHAHHEFWSYMIHQKSALASVVSFLQNCIPFYVNILGVSIPDNIKRLHEDILNLVVRIIFRILTSKESSECWIEKDHLRELVYQNYLISVPMLLDLLIAVGNAASENVTLLRKIFESLLKIEPKYKQDLITALKFLETAFRSIQMQTDNEGFEGAGGGLLDKMSDTPFDDVTLYTLNCSFTISVLLEVCPEMRSLYGEEGFAQHIARFYDTTLPQLYKNIYNINSSALSLVWLNQSRIQFLRAFRSIISFHVEAVLTDPASSLAPCENFIAILTECLSEQAFVVDYERHYPIALDVEILKQACNELDSFKITFLIEGYQRERNVEAFKSNQRTNVEQSKDNGHVLNVENKSAEIYLNGKTSVPTVSNPVQQRDIESEVAMVLDCFPDLGTGFIRRLLTRYDNGEEAIAALLEENLPPDLFDLNRSEVYIPPDLQDKLTQEIGVKHYNVFDGDKYDVLTQDDPKCVVKKGKGFPNAPKNVAQLLDDKSDIAMLRDRYREYSLIAEGDSTEEQEYEDEYDDSYEVVLESESRVVKSKQFKQVLADVADESEDESDSEDCDEMVKEKRIETGENDGREKFAHFCENPEEVRARYEMSCRMKSSQKSGSRKMQNHRDVVGGTKGQGQDKEVLRNRQKKESQKSTRANHNRKAGAAFKRNKGMIS
uniref:CUE domain-containing protein n=1 Tax=Glossina palpalis gambiensis TaxID=67801 RepID=A0A1B0B9S7_9MUSC